MDKTDLKLIVGFLLTVFIICTAAAVSINYYNEYLCNSYGKVTQRNTEWVFMNACYVEASDNFWLTLAEYKNSIIAHRGLIGETK